MTATAKLKAIQAQLRVVPVEETLPWKRISTSQSMCNLPRRKSSLQVKPMSPIKIVSPARKLSDSTTSSRSVSPPNMAYLGLNPNADPTASSPMSRKSLELLMEAGEFEKPGKMFKVGSCKHIDELEEVRYDVADSFDEFINDFELVDDESDCDFH